MPAERINMPITLDQLLPGEADIPAIPVTGIASDSRKLAPGNLFLACQGATSHGLDFIDQATAAGVAAIAWDSTTANAVDCELPMFPIPGLAQKIGGIANRWFDSPTAKMKVAGVTGTNGKTTVAYLIQQCLQRLQRKSAYIGTLGVGIDGVMDGGYMTTPPCIELQELFAGFHDAGAEFAAIEVSSHALQQKRVDGVHFDVAVFTNLSRDHIDYHGSMRAYGEAKASLFLDYDIGNSIVNVDTPFGASLAERCGANVVTVATTIERPATGRPHITVLDVARAGSGYDIWFGSTWGEGELRLPLPGKFNIANALDVLATLLCWDVSLSEACNVLGQVEAPAGRMQKVQVEGAADLPSVYVDYSHTPASLEAALTALRDHGKGQLWCVFGCGGDRDRGKRPMMGRAVAEHADVAVVTSDNPRSESPQQILNDVLAGMPEGVTAIVDRAEAIDHAIVNAAPQDIVLIAGKGHEHYQLIAGQRLRFSDLETANTSLLARLGTSGASR